MVYGSQNPHCTNSLIYVVKRPTVEFDQYNDSKTPTGVFDIYNDGQIPTTRYDFDEKVGGDLQIAEGTMVTKECWVL